MKRFFLIFAFSFVALSVFADYYEETNSCVNGRVDYEGQSDYFIIQTRSGYTILEVYSGYLYEGDIIRGELNRYGFKYIITESGREVRVYIEDYALTASRAVEWMGEHGRLSYSDQKAFNNQNK